MTVKSADWRSIFDPFARELISSPYPQYERLRSTEPIHWSPPLRSWVLTRMEDIRAVLDDTRFVAVETSKVLSDLASRSGRDYDAIICALKAVLFFKDGPAHRKDRRTISRIVNRTPLTQLEPVIDQFAADLASKFSAGTDFDIISEYADPLPQYVMAHILGLPQADVPVLGELLADFTLTFDIASLDVYDRLNRKVLAALSLIRLRIEEALKADPESPLAFIYSQTSDADRLQGAAAIALFAYRVGAETTTGLIGLSIYTLLCRPDLYRAVQTDRSIIPAYVAEVLRLESNVQRVVRICNKARVFRDTTINEGDRVLLLIGAANRDPDSYSNPNDLRMRRSEEADLVFGSGHHFCIGASLARLEGRIALERFSQLPQVELAGQGDWYDGRSIRRLVKLPVRNVINRG
jgi:cytochrome P450